MGVSPVAMLYLRLSIEASSTLIIFITPIETAVAVYETMWGDLSVELGVNPTERSTN